MALPAIAGAVAPLPSIPTTPTLPATGQIGWTGGANFGQTLSRALDSLQAAQTKADTLAVQAATGDLTNVHDYMIAATEASLATELTVAVRNKAVEAFNQIMNMGV
jgi:flagellar hook-basal body complex protein FliE